MESAQRFAINRTDWLLKLLNAAIEIHTPERKRFFWSKIMASLMAVIGKFGLKGFETHFLKSPNGWGAKQLG